MAKRSHSRRTGVAAEPLLKSAVTRPARVPEVSRRTPLHLRLAAMILVPLLAFLLLEGALRLFRYGSPTTFFVKADAETLTTNPKFAWQFYSRETATSPTPLRVKKTKPAGTKRILILGESAAAGTPDPAFSFSRMLDLMLASRFPNQQFEVINVAMRGIDSHIVKRIARESMQLSPDLVIVYMGNNDVIGLHAPDPSRPTLFAQPAFIWLQHAVKRTRVAQLTESFLRSVGPSKPVKQEMEFLRKQRLAFDDPKRAIIYSNHQRNLDEICRMAVSANAEVIVCSVAVNLRDFPPLGSLHRRGLARDQIEEWQRLYNQGATAEREGRTADALTLFNAAAAIDDHFAELHFRVARCAETLGDREKARNHYVLARDRDALQFRSDSRINANVREVAARWGTNHVRFVDVENAFARSRLSEHGLPGARLFQEHVHFLFEGDHELAMTLLPEAEAALNISGPAEKQSVSLALPAVLDRDTCARKLGYTPVEAANVFSAVAELTAKPPFLDQLDNELRVAALRAKAKGAFQAIDSKAIEQTRQIYLAALAERPNDWMLRLNYARLLSDIGDHANAAGEFEKVTTLFPLQKSLRMMYAASLMQAKRTDGAVRELEEIVKIDPGFAPAKNALVAIRGKRG